MTGRGWLGVLVLAIGVGVGGLVWIRGEGTPPTIDATPKLAVGSGGREIEIGVSDAGAGPRSLSAVLRHARGETPLLDAAWPGSLWGGGVGNPVRKATVVLDPKKLDLPEGQSFLVLSARDWSWRKLFTGNETRLEVPVAVDLTRPRVRVESGLTYVKRGGAGAVAYSLSEPVARDGVRVGDAFFPGHPATPGSKTRRVALFAIPTDAPPDPEIRVVAEDAAGNEGRGSWAVVFQERPLPEANVTLSSTFLETKARDLAEAHDIETDDLVAAFDRVNTRLRAENEAHIRELIADSAPERLFEGAFQQMDNSKVTSRFAEQRTYFVDGRAVSRATHFGYDLASTSSAPITAANAGRVLFAGDLGIYGTTVLIDHGLGLTTLYGHLSSLEVSEGDRVEAGQVLGRSGATGLAGGDHLHFGILVGGHYVDPLEWWDPEWVRTHVDVNLKPPPPA